MTIKAWQGPSTIDGQDIMAVVSCEKRKSTNRKTGDMAQVAFFRTDQPPLDASKSGADESVCGQCPRRPKLWTKEVSKEPCYVRLDWKKAQWNAGNNAELDMSAAIKAMSKKPVRFGEYGNMSSIPRDVAEQLLQAADRWTLYEHEWQKDSNQWLRAAAMASVHTKTEALEAHAMGWRTFRVMPEGDTPMDSEVVCPYETHKVQCKDCMLCMGQGKPAKSVCVTAH